MTGPLAVTAQTRNLGVEYPVAVDSGYSVCSAYANHFWPAVYIADADGRIRRHHFGEGEYAQTEMVIQRLLDAGAMDLDQDLVGVQPRGLEVAADWQALLLFVHVRGLVHPGSRLAAAPLARWGPVVRRVRLPPPRPVRALPAPGHPDQTGATTVPGLLVQNGAVVVLPFVVSWLLSSTPLLRRTA